MRKRPVSRGWIIAAAGVVAVMLVSWMLFSIRSLGDELEQSKADSAALAAQVRSLGGQPVAEGKPGERGDVGPQGVPGPQGPQGPPGVPGPRGPIGVRGQSPACLLEPTRCVGPRGPAGPQGKQGATGSKGDTGATGATGDQGVPGVAGKDGADGKPGADGKDGATGPPGTPGRGIASIVCQDSGDWLITYTDKETSTTDGPCRVVTPPDKPDPAPAAQKGN